MECEFIMPNLKPEEAIKFISDIIHDPAFIELEKPYVSDILREQYGLTERQQANIEVRLEKIFSYLIGR